MNETVCVSMSCTHPRRRYACGHTDCIHVFDGDTCIACGVRKRVGAERDVVPSSVVIFAITRVFGEPIRRGHR